jgi:hypothetical protein
MIANEENQWWRAINQLFQFTCGHIKPILGSFEINNNKQKVAHEIKKIKAKDSEKKRSKHVQNTLTQIEHTTWRTIEKENTAKHGMLYVVVIRATSEQIPQWFKNMVWTHFLSYRRFGLGITYE